MSVQTSSLQQNVLHLISRIQCEDIRKKREQRETNRQNLTVPVTIRSTSSDEAIAAVSRDLSSMGMGLISTEPVEQDVIYELELELESGLKSVYGKCLWCRPFGTRFLLSGWRFHQPEAADHVQ